ncbi:MAG: NlpC/P60 family protein [Cellulosilyticum sp.]|nr:NlpC/P60 family protein [Cellulosilyticum sp.]
MKKKLLHMVLGTILVTCCYTNIMADEIDIMDENINEYSIQVNETLDNVEEIPIIEPEEVKVSTGESVVDYAKQFIGTPYVSGGNDLNSGVDCSGFTQQVYKHFDIQLERRSSSQYANNGYAVSKSELKPGDLVFYGYGSVCHVAIYIGDNEVIHAPVPGKSVCIVPLWQNGDAPLIGYKRIFND